MSEEAKRRLSESVAALRGEIEDERRDLETLFQRLNTSDRRLKSVPVLPMASISIPYELATREALRGLELCEGASLLLDQSNFVAAQPVIRSLYETWILLGYAETRFRELVFESDKWTRFSDLAMRLLTQRSAKGPAEDESELIGIGMMLDHVAGTFAADEGTEGDDTPEGYPGAQQFLKDVYDQMSDGTHPTMWPLMPYGDIRPDGLGIAWEREPDHDFGLVPLMTDLKMSLGFVVRGLKALVATADNIYEKFRGMGFSLEPANLDAAIAVLERVLESEPDLPEEALAVLRERGSALLEAFKQQRASGRQSD